MRSVTSKLLDPNSFRFALYKDTKMGATIDIVRDLDPSKGDEANGGETFARLAFPSMEVATAIYLALSARMTAHALAEVFVAGKNNGMTGNEF